jgi:hypothetical protein
VFLVQIRVIVLKIVYAQLIRSVSIETEQMSERAYCLIGCGLLRRNVGVQMRPSQSTSFLTDASNVVDLGRYRNARQLRSPDLSRTARTPEKPRNSSDLWLGDDYRERMKVNAVVFIFLMFLITSGIWLLDSLNESFGPERLSHHQSQNHDVDAGTMVRLANEIRNLL